MRFPVAIPAEMVTGQAENRIGLVKDVSRFGMRMVCDSAQSDLSGLLALKIKNPQGQDYFDARAEVAWKKDLEGKWEIGLRLVEMAPERKTEILDYAFSLWRQTAPQTACN